MRPLLAILLLASCSSDPGGVPFRCDMTFSDTGDVRVFTVAPKISLDDAQSYEAYRAHMEGLVAQRVAPCLSKARPNLLVFPEYVGLSAAFIGSRGAPSRAKATSLDAFFALLVPYEKQVDYYGRKFGSTRLSAGRQIVLALTDTLRRGYYDTFAGIAKRWGVYVVATSPIATDVEASTDPEDIAVLHDPDRPAPAQVFVAMSPATHNRASVWGPDGTEVGHVDKPYLVELEESAELDLDYGSLDDEKPIELPFGKVGILISKDAWMPDVLDRLDLAGTQLLLQPEGFDGGWAIGGANEWLPDVYQESGWAATQKYASFRAYASSMMTGNFFDIVFDGQSAFARDGRADDARLHFIGQSGDTGWLQIGPWVGDGGPSDRTALRATGEALRQSNAYLETVLGQDLSIGCDMHGVALDVDTDGTTDVSVKDGVVLRGTSVIGGDGAARAPTVAGGVVAWQEGGHVFAARTGQPAMDLGDGWLPRLAAGPPNHYLAYVRTGSGNERIYLRRSTDGGMTWSFATPIDSPQLPHPSGNTRNNQWSPAIAVAGMRVVVAWTDFRNYSWEIFAAQSRDAGMTFENPVRVDDTDTEAERIQSDPALLAEATGTFRLAWTDQRKRGPYTGLRSATFDPLAGWSASTEPAHAPAPMWRPVATAGGVIWQDFRDGYSAVRSEAGMISDPAAQAFRPRAAGTHVVWTEIRCP